MASINESNFYELTKNSMFLEFIESKNCVETILHFRQNYYQHGDIVKHFHYLIMLDEDRKLLGRFPTKEEFYRKFFQECPCGCNITFEDFFRACELFMSSSGDSSSISCFYVQILNIFVNMENRIPTMSEFLVFLRNYRESLIREYEEENKEIQEESNEIVQGVSSEKIELLKTGIFEKEEKDAETCGLCQEEICIGQKILKLECNHLYHSENCCENGTIFTWFENKNTCPMCRAKI